MKNTETVYVPLDDIVGFPHYRIGSDQTIWSRRIKGHATRIGPWKKLKQTPNHLGYLYCDACSQGKTKRLAVHRLMMLAFVGPCPKGLEVLHIDGVKTNNILSNLRYGTHKENMQDMVKHGHFVHPNCKGEEVGTSKLTEEQVRQIRSLHVPRKFPMRKLAEMFGVSRSNIKQIIRRTSWNHI